MPCKVGYPSSPCPFGYDGRVTRVACGSCKNYAPPPHIQQWCMLWDREGILCKLPKSACDQCPDKHVRGPGRPGGLGETDWRDPASVRAYFEKYRQEHPGKAAEAMAKFLEKRPDYFTKYREQNRERMREIARRYYHNKKRRANAGGEG